MSFLPQLNCVSPQSPSKKLIYLQGATWKAFTLVFEVQKGDKKLSTASSFLIVCLEGFSYVLSSSQACSYGCWFMHHGPWMEEETACAQERCKGIENSRSLACQGNMLRSLHICKTVLVLLSFCISVSFPLTQWCQLHCFPPISESASISTSLMVNCIVLSTSGNIIWHTHTFLI